MGSPFLSPSEGTTVRPTATGLATAFFRLYLLESLAAGQARPAALLAAIAAERLPFAAGAFGRDLQSLVEGGYLAPGAAATVCPDCDRQVSDAAGQWFARNPRDDGGR